MAHDVFISHSAKDKAVADAVCAALEASGIRCWIAPRDILPGADWSGSIVNAIETSKAMVLIFSAKVNVSPPIRAEIEQAFKRNIPIIPFRIENVVPAENLEFFLNTRQWFDAYAAPMKDNIERLLAVIANLLDVPIERVVRQDQPLAGRFKRTLSFLALCVGSVLVTVLCAILIGGSPKPANKPHPANTPHIESARSSEPVGDDGDTSGPLSGADFQRVAGITKTTSFDEIVKWYGETEPYDHRTMRRQYVWKSDAGEWLTFNLTDMKYVTISCKNAPSLNPKSAIMRLCALPKAKRATLLTGFVRAGESGKPQDDEEWNSPSGDVCLFISDDRITVMWDCMSLHVPRDAVADP